jgi:hypothetical protein
MRVLHQTIGDTMIWHTFDDGRRTVRRRLGHIGTIIAEPDTTPHYCLVIDGSDSGVRVRAAPDFEVPGKFILRHAGTEANYKVIWRNGRLVGAERVSRVKRLTHARERSGQAA